MRRIPIFYRLLGSHEMNFECQMLRQWSGQSVHGTVKIVTWHASVDFNHLLDVKNVTEVTRQERSTSSEKALAELPWWRRTITFNCSSLLLHKLLSTQSTNCWNAQMKKVAPSNFTKNVIYDGINSMNVLLEKFCFIKHVQAKLQSSSWWSCC